MDHVELSRPVDGRWPYILAVRDLGSGCQLAWLPVPDETAETTIVALQWLFEDHGPPLVLKSDNGSGFISAASRSSWIGIRCSPSSLAPWTPEYNGACEAGNGALQTYTHRQAARQGRTGHWTAGDLEAGRRMANELVYPDGPTGPTRRERLTPRPLRRSRTAAFGRTVQREQAAGASQARIPPDTELGHAAQRDRSCSNRLCSRRARLPQCHPEVNYSIT